VPAEPVSWQPAPDPGFAGDHARNTRLAGLQRIALHGAAGPEHMPPAYGHVIAFTEDGKIVADLQDPSGGYPQTTGVLETGDRLYVQSLDAPAIGWLSRKAAGL
jgi:hypothetical protein